MAGACAESVPYQAAAAAVMPVAVSVPSALKYIGNPEEVMYGRSLGNINQRMGE